MNRVFLVSASVLAILILFSVSLAFASSIGDFVWNDLNSNGVQDVGEPGIEGVTLDLFKNGSYFDYVATATTDVNGFYDFTNLSDGHYYVQVTDANGVLAGFSLTTSSDRIEIFLSTDQDYDDADFGYRNQPPNASIGDLVWNDLNGDGVQDTGEPGIEGVTLTLYREGAFHSTTTTGADGSYDFTGLEPGNYKLLVDTPSGSVLTTSNHPLYVALGVDQDYDDADFGFREVHGSIGDFVWNDLNGDGVQDTGEPGIEGVTLDLFKNGAYFDYVATATTDVDGFYDFTSLSDGHYYVEVTDANGVLAGFSLTTSSDRIEIFLSTDQDYDDADFGYYTETPGEMKWAFTTGSDVWSSPAISEDSTIYVGSHDNNLYAINPDGTEKWRFTTGSYVYSSPAIGADGTIYVGSSDNNLYAINPDGAEKWRFTTGSYVYSSPAIGSDGTVYVGSEDYNLYAINPDGTEKWWFTTGGRVVNSSPAIGADGTIYVGSVDNNLYAINPDGTEKWRFTTGSYVYSSPAIGEDGTIYVGSYDNNLYAINPDGTEKWRFPTGNWLFSSPAIGADGTIYVGSDDYNLYAINPDGTEKWRFPTDACVYSSPAVGADGTIYAGSRHSRLYAINPDGTEKWWYQTSNWVFSSPAVGSDGTIYVGSVDGNLYAIYGSSGGLADTPWPMFHHDLKHTGCIAGVSPGWSIALTTTGFDLATRASLEFDSSVQSIMGASPDALDGYDPLDLPLPPRGMPPLLDAYFEGEALFPRLGKDYRAAEAHGLFNKTWLFHGYIDDADPGSSSGFQVCWDMSDFPMDLDAFITQLDADGNPVRPPIDMRSQSCFDIAFQESVEHRFSIHVGQVSSIDIPMAAGWNMLSCPGDPVVSDIPALVAGTPVLPFAYTWDSATGTYTLLDSIAFGVGYWFASTEDCVLSMLYLPRRTLTHPINRGWNMTGSIDCVCPVGSITSDPPDSILTNSIYTWNTDIQNYEIVTDIVPGGGYWTAAIAGCVMSMSCVTSPMAQSIELADSASPTWRSMIAVESQDQQEKLLFGMHPSASDGFDRLLDKPLPPPPAAFSDDVKGRGNGKLDGVLKAGWLIEHLHFSMLAESYVKEASQGKWELSIELPRPGKIEWSDLPEGYRCMLHYDKRSIDMNTKKFLPLPAGEYNLTLVLDALDSLPRKTQLLANYPNPFNPETWIPYELKEDNDVAIRIYTATGQLVRTLSLGHKRAGFYATKAKAAYWDGRNEAGEDVASGIYFYTIQAGSFTATKKMVIAR